MRLVLPLAEPDRAKWARLADWLAAATAASLPWSTSATSILLVVWMIVLLPLLSVADVRREVMTPVGGLPVLLWALGAIGMLWANDASFADRLGGLGGFHKLLLIPLLMAQFRRSENVDLVIRLFLFSCLALLVLSSISVFTPRLQVSPDVPGVPLKDYLAQSAWFQVCLFGLIYRSLERAYTVRDRLIYAVLAAAFLIDIVYVASSRTTFVAMPILVVLLGWRRFGAKGLIGACVIAALAGGLLWSSSAYMRERILTVFEEAKVDRTAQRQSSTGQRLEFWQKSMGFIQEAPVLGHGTGSIKTLFRKAAVGDVGAASVIADNPHQQTFVVAIQLGVVGALVLWAMWVAHFLLFQVRGFVPWLGLVIVTQNIISSLFNSHLFDFNQGWLYVIGVGILGGVATRPAEHPAAAKKLPSG